MVLSHSHDAAIARAKLRAEARRIVATETEATADGPNETKWYRVNSFTSPGVVHGVRLTFSAAGIDFLCSCPAGERGTICQHTAAALETLNAPQEPEPPAPLSTLVDTPISRGRAALDLLNGDPSDYLFTQTA